MKSRLLCRQILRWFTAFTCLVAACWSFLQAVFHWWVGEDPDHSWHGHAATSNRYLALAGVLFLAGVAVVWWMRPRRND